MPSSVLPQSTRVADHLAYRRSKLYSNVRYIVRTLADLAEKLDVNDRMRQRNGKVSRSKALVRGLAKELDIDESLLTRLAEEARKDLGSN
jgi:hypothetical protein